MFSSEPSSSLISPLIALPLELKQHISSYLEEGPEPALTILRRTHPHFRYIIPKAVQRSKLPYEQYCAILLAADRLAPDYQQKGLNLFPPNHFACFICLEVLPGGRFTDRSIHSVKRVGGRDAHKRCCVNCGLWNLRLSPKPFKIDRLYYAVSWCGQRCYRRDDGEAMCERCRSIVVLPPARPHASWCNGLHYTLRRIEWSWNLGWHYPWDCVWPSPVMTLSQVREKGNSCEMAR